MGKIATFAAIIIPTVMKKLIYQFFIVTVLTVFSVSCGKSSPDSPKDDNKGQQEETIYSVVGVWKSGNNLISFHSDGFYCAYLGDKFIDNGYYKQDKNESVVCDNYYYNRKTTYKLTSINENRMTVDVSSKDVFGVDFTKKMTFEKTTIEPTKEKHELTAKSWSYVSTLGTITNSFVTNDTGTQTHSANPMKRCPLKFFYVYINGYAYLQYSYLSEVLQIGGWSEKAESKDIIALKIDFGPDGSMSFIGDSSVL